MASENVSKFGEQHVKVTLDGSLENVLKRLRLNKAESVALTALMCKDGKVDAHIKDFIKIEMEIIK